MGPPCDPVDGWAITEYKGQQLLHCGYDRGTTEEFLSKGDEAFESANAWWTKTFGGTGVNPNSGPFNNDCYMPHYQMSCYGPQHCHSFENRSFVNSTAAGQGLLV